MHLCHCSLFCFQHYRTHITIWLVICKAGTGHIQSAVKAVKHRACAHNKKEKTFCEWSNQSAGEGFWVKAAGFQSCTQLTTASIVTVRSERAPAPWKSPMWACHIHIGNCRWQILLDERGTVKTLARPAEKNVNSRQQCWSEVEF